MSSSPLVAILVFAVVALTCGGVGCSSQRNTAEKGQDARSDRPGEIAGGSGVGDAGALSAGRGDAAVPGSEGETGDEVVVYEREPLFPPEVRSLRLLRSITVRMEPRENAERYGTVAADTRVGWRRATRNDDCDQRWIEIEPYGWVCEVYLEPSKRRPRGVEVPRLESDELVPGVYGKVIGEEPMTFQLQNDALVEGRQLSGSVMVRRYGDITVEEVEHWAIDKARREYLATSEIREYRPSEWKGTRLGDDTGLQLPVGFPLSRKNVSHRVPVFSAARGGRVVGKLEGRRPVAVLETVWEHAPQGQSEGQSEGQTAGPGEDQSGVPARGRAIAHRIGDGEWVRASEMRVAWSSAPPPDVGELERWLDIDLDSQVLVAYEGELAVYVTLVATGSRKNPTETGIYRMWVKFAETDMSDLAGESPYSVATVPWTQFYAKDLALHTAYWHDTFGTPRSHGCTNLAPIDARFLYFWSEPEVPPGWSMAKGTILRPGSLVRIHSQADPDPEYRGYAERVRHARAGRSP